MQCLKHLMASAAQQPSSPAAQQPSGSAAGCADKRGVSITTVRTQIRSLLHKTASENIKGLVQMVSSLPGVRGG